MAINFETHAPQELLFAFKKEIDEGRVHDWEYDEDGDFIHVPDRWRYKAWLRPTIEEGRRLTFNFLGRSDARAKAIFCVYHGRLIEAMLTHCDDLFTSVTSSAAATNGDFTVSKG